MIIEIRDIAMVQHPDDVRRALGAKLVLQDVKQEKIKMGLVKDKFNLIWKQTRKIFEER